MRKQTFKHISLRLFVYTIVTLATACTTQPKANVQNKSNTPPPQIKLIDPIYTEIKENRIIYKGVALSAEYFGETQPGIVVKPYIEGVLKNGESFSVSSDIGYYDVRTHVITFNDNTNAVLNNTYTLKSNKVQYLINKKLIVSDDPITIYGRDLQLYGDRGSIDLEKNLIFIKGNISAKIYKVRLR